jgi:hypothetical protein
MEGSTDKPNGPRSPAQLTVRTCSALRRPIGSKKRLRDPRVLPGLLGGRTPLQAYSARLKARPPGGGPADTHFRVRQDRVDSNGTVTLRHDSKLHHIGIGRAHKRRPVKLLVAEREVRVLDLDTGELICQLTLDPTRNYRPIGAR